MQRGDSLQVLPKIITFTYHTKRIIIISGLCGVCSITRIQQPSLIYRVKVLHYTQHKIGHFGEVLPIQSLGLVLKNETNTKANMHP